ncbi:hypothetical protein [Actinoplanes sp. NBRC 101535]|uniref:hypothetical protein n=1 Tax=Actinoplanes sp. NBRC 101535 TaxID=3032196 RepID=UPI0024A3552B|nr:hypothetical protein [Actinoplanes sp. NBRC 101535]GLY06309.1 hypothetical protein Acsp01_66880 [Actinoplanes sp. NBRC 101535]
MRGLARNPGLPPDLLLRVIDHPAVESYHVMARREFTDATFDLLAAHPDARVRVHLAEAEGATPGQRARMLDDPSPEVIKALLVGPYARWWVPLPPEVTGQPPRERVRPVPLSRAEAEEMARDDEDEWQRARAALEPALSTGTVGRLTRDPHPTVRQHVAMRAGLTEAERAAIDYRVEQGDYLAVPDWVLDADGDLLTACVRSAHPGLRRAAAFHRDLTAEHIAILAADDDFPVRLLLCEFQAAVPVDVVVRTHLAGTTINIGDLLWHPALRAADLTGYADDPDPGARALVPLDRRAPAGLIERLSHDADPWVRSAVAGDGRLSAERVLELYADPETTAAASANPHLPVTVMERILAEADHLSGPPRP